MKKILVVCMGNICRSPTGEAVLKATAKKLGVSVEVDSAGTIDYHTGSTPDDRARMAAESRGYSFDGMVARQVVSEDFEYFDMILAADRENMSHLMSWCPAEFKHKISLFLSHSTSEYSEIPDPYYDGGFEHVLDLIEEASTAVLKKMKCVSNNI